VKEAGDHLGQYRDRARQRGPAVEPRLSFFWRNKWIALGLYGFPFSVGPYPTSVARFRALARRTRFAWRGQLFQTLANIAMTLGWPVGACLTARITCSDKHRRGKTQYRMRVFFDMTWLALRHSIPPDEYARYRFDDPERRKDMHEYVYWNDLPGLGALNARLGADNRDVQDKSRFAEICASSGIPHVATLAVFDRGKQIHPEAAFVPDAFILWVKSLHLKGGAGGAKWIKDGEAYRNVTGRMVPAAQLAEEFRKDDCLVQPFIENHPDVARVTNGALASLRIVTGMNAGGQAEFVTALISLPCGSLQTSVGGIFCSIEYDPGRIRRAALPGGEVVANHPDTGAPIVGNVIPYWHESIDLALRAHATAFSRFAFLGWDIALTKEKPLLLEANSGWGAIPHQMLDGPLGHTSFSQIVSHYV